MPRLLFSVGVVAAALFAAACAAPSADATGDDLSQEALESGSALAKLPPGRYVIYAAEITKPAILRGLILTVPAGRASATVSSSYCPLSVVKKDGTFASAVRSSHAEDTFGDPGWDDHPWVSDGARSNGSSWTCSGKLTLDDKGLALDMLESYSAPQTYGYVLQGRLGPGTILAQAAASNGGRFPAGVQSEIVAASDAVQLADYWKAVFFRDAKGRRYVAEAKALTSGASGPAYAVEIGAPTTMSYVCRNDGRTTTASAPSYDWHLDGCGKNVASAGRFDREVRFSTDQTSNRLYGRFAVPSWF